MMGADSVAYHYANAAERADDHPGRALEYYASRGETPLQWGGSGAAELGLVGTVTQSQFTALYGPGGAKAPPRASGWCRPGARAWSWSSPPTRAWPSWE
jgi:hypothetical protein